MPEWRRGNERVGRSRGGVEEKTFSATTPSRATYAGFGVAASRLGIGGGCVIFVIVFVIVNVLTLPQDGIGRIRPVSHTCSENEPIVKLSLLN